MADDNLGGKTRNFIEVFFHSHPFDQVAESNGSGNLSKDRVSIGVPLNQGLTFLHILSISNLELGRIYNRVPFFFTTGSILNYKTSVTVHNNDFSVLIFEGAQAKILDDTSALGIQSGLLNDPAGSSTNMEGSHRKLGSRLTDRLCRNYTHRLTHFHPFQGRHIAPITFNTNPLLRFAGQARTYSNFFNTGVFNCYHRFLVNQAIRFGQDVSGKRINHILENRPPENSFSQGLDDFTRLH